MLSIIICSKYSTLNPAFVQNISETVGTDYEIVHIDNSQQRYNIFEAYNIGVGQAKGDKLCLMHEDIVFHSNGWGKVVERYLSDDKVGALGVAGGHVITDRLDWRFYGFGKMYLIQGTTTIEESPQYYTFYRPITDGSEEAIIQVAAIDGVWMCFRKDIFQEIHFDDHTFHDFHLYDSDISMQVNMTGHGVYITSEILLEHQSEGTFTDGYREALKAFAEKWKGKFPVIKGIEVTQQQIDEALNNAQSYFDSRLRHDAVVIGLRQLFAKRRKGLPTREYTAEDIKLMDESLYQCCRISFKYKQLSFRESLKLLRHYLQMPFAQRKALLTRKFIWYRLLR